MINREQQIVWHGLILTPGLPQSGKSEGKMKIFQGQGKVREFFKSLGKSLILSKSVNCQGILSSSLQFISFLQDLKNAFSFGKDE